MKRLLVGVALMSVSVSSAFAQIDLTWDNCATASVANSEGPPATSKTFDCTAQHTYRLHGSFKTPVDVPDFFAMDISIDLGHLAPGPLVPFYHYETGGCNTAGIALSDNKSTSGLNGDGNACAHFTSPWGVFGEETEFAGITAYGPDYGFPGRGRLLASIARASNDPFPLEANRNYYAFHLTMTTTQRTTCAGCGAQAVLVWNTATLYGAGDPVTLVILSGPSAKSPLACATIGVTFLNCLLSATRNTTWGQLKSIYR